MPAHALPPIRLARNGHRIHDLACVETALAPSRLSSLVPGPVNCKPGANARPPDGPGRGPTPHDWLIALDGEKSFVCLEEGQTTYHHMAS